MSESEYWDRISRRRIELGRSGAGERRVEWETDDPAAFFAEMACDYARDVETVLDIGCGDGTIARCAANYARMVVALEFSQAAIASAAESTEGAAVSFVLADARALPFEEEAFDLVYSRWLPGSTSPKAISEIARVLRPGGTLLGLAVGELHRIETQEVFGRGMHWPPARPVRFTVPEALAAAGLETTSFAEYFASSYCSGIEAFAAELTTLPIIPDFDPNKDAALLREVTRKLTTEHGIKDTEHAALFVAWKAKQG